MSDPFDWTPEREAEWRAAAERNLGPLVFMPDSPETDSL